jgi:hypothetical protein
MCEIKYLDLNWDPGDVLVLETDGNINSWKYFHFGKGYQEYKKSISENTRVHIFMVMQRQTWSYATAAHLSTMLCNESEIMGSFTDEKPIIKKYVDFPKIDPETEYTITCVGTGEVKKMKGKDLM